MKQPGWQEPEWQICPEAHTVPSGVYDQAVVLVAGAHIWQTLPDFSAPAAKYWPPIQHPLTQEPVRQMSAAPQLAPSARLDHADTLVAGVHAWQALLGFGAPVE